MSFSIKKFSISLSGIFMIAALAACSPEVGSKEWCEELEEKPKGDWSANEATEFTKSCVF